jgi:hypothetical protein
VTKRMITEFYTLREMADKFQHKEETIRRKVAKGEFPFKAIDLEFCDMVFSAKEVEATIDDMAHKQNKFVPFKVKAV